MLKLRIEEILIEQNKSKYWLAKTLGMHYVSFKKMIENDTASIRFSTLDALCKALNVTVGDLFYDDEENNNSPK
ncbi:MAG: helix-turn-helix transcriptional regulator [Lachnospiraceae bacterium]|nr:helix-turn-helix transcriptional regulator [Lachnospiraceae bacterium]